MELPKKRESKKVHKHPNWDPFRFFFLLAFPPAFILTIIFIFLEVKTTFYSDRVGVGRYGLLTKGYCGVFLFLWLFISFYLALFYVICFLVKMIREKPAHQKNAIKYLLIFFADQLFTFSFCVALGKNLLWFWLIALSGFFIHYFFSRPVMKLLHNQYPRHFPKFFNKHTNSFGKVYNMSWPFAITMFNVNLQLIFLLLFFCA